MSLTFARYETDPKLVLFYARGAAYMQGQRTITPEHLLFGCTIRQHANDCAFRRLKEQADALRKACGIDGLELPELKDLRGEAFVLNSRAKFVLRYTLQEANAAKHYWVDIDHLLLGLLREGGLAAQALRGQGWNEQVIREGAAAGRARYPQKPVPHLKGMLARLGIVRPVHVAFLVGLGLGFVAVLLYLRWQTLR